MNIPTVKVKAPTNRLTSDEQAKLLLAAIVESSDDAIIAKNLDGIITSWNAAATRIFGYEPDEIIGRSVLTLIPPELHSDEPEILRKLRAGERIDHYETQRVRKDGTRLDVSLTISPVRNHDGQVIGASKIARDISDRKRAEAVLIQTEKLAAVGRMAASIAHEVNNPLEAITNLAYLLTIHSSLDDEARSYARMLLDEVGRVSHITKQTLAFYRDSVRPSPVNLPELVDSVLELHRPAMMRKKVRLVTSYRHQPAMVKGFAAELRQVFANLILNAVDALPPEGVLRVDVRSLNGEVRVTVADNGCGITPHGRARLFQPFFTTKIGRGNGLGLWVSEGIIRKHGGRVRVHTSTRPGRSGTAFTVVLPSYVEGVSSRAA
jgi:two-component system, chemotaxis family, CheB/CheR fusion protein